MPRVSIATLASWVEGSVVGDSRKTVAGICDLGSATADDLSFVSSPKYAALAESSAAGCLLVKTPLGDRPQIVCQDPYLAFALVAARLLEDLPAEPAGIHASACIDATARIHTSATVEAGAVIAAGAVVGAGSRIGAQAYVGRDAWVGRDCILHPAARVLNRVQVGDRCILHAGCVLGSDGFGYACDPRTGKRHKIPQIGIVRVEDDVEIGANTTIDRATFGETVIGAGTKIDNLVQLGHNVRIGQDCVIVSQAGIAGSSTLGARVVMGAQAGMVGHIHVAADVTLAARAGVTRAPKRRGVYSGFPLLPHRTWLSVQAVGQTLPALRARLRELEARFSRLETTSSSK